MKKPKEIIIGGIPYKIIYCDKPSEVDVFKRESLWGQIDYWERTIRIFANGKQPAEEVWATLIHEMLHGITKHYGVVFDAGKEEGIITALAHGLIDTLLRNGLLKIKD